MDITDHSHLTMIDHSQLAMHMYIHVLVHVCTLDVSTCMHLEYMTIKFNIGCIS